MRIGGRRFNIYLALALVLLCGCQSPETKRKKALSTFRIHLEANPFTPAEQTEEISVPRSNPVKFIVQKAPLLTEEFVKEAKLADVRGGFALRVQFDRRGTWLLEQYTTGNMGKHFAIFSQFAEPPDEKLNKGRWLAAPRISQHIGSGILLFTPDASREETEQIVLGLNNLAKKLGKESDL